MSQLKKSTTCILKAILQKGLMWFPCAKPLFEFSNEKRTVVFLTMMIVFSMSRSK